MTHKQIILAGMLVGGMIFLIGMILLWFIVTPSVNTDNIELQSRNESALEDSSNISMMPASVDNIDCENRVTSFTVNDYEYQLNNNSLKLITSKDFPIKLDIEGDFIVDQNFPEWPFIIQGKLKGSNIPIRQGLTMHKYGFACSKKIDENLVKYHANVSKLGNDYWKNEMPDLTFIKNGKKVLTSDGIIYYWYLFKSNISTSEKGNHYSILAYAYKNSIDYRFSYNFKILDNYPDESVNSNDFDATINYALQFFSLYEI